MPGRIFCQTARQPAPAKASHSCGAAIENGSSPKTFTKAPSGALRLRVDVVDSLCQLEVLRRDSGLAVR